MYDLHRGFFMLKQLTIGTVCSGIGAPEIAFGNFGFKPIWFSEIEKFPSAVLKYHYPDVPNLGDFTKPETQEYMTANPPDVFVGGTPCQAFSVAGLRNSLSDDRGNLTLKFVELWHGLRTVGTRYAVWENVEGVLSTKDNAFGCFLSGMVGEEYPITTAGGRWSNAGVVNGPRGCVAWRTFDAQYWGVPQRRRRIFAVIGRSGDFSVTKILFKPESLSWNSDQSQTERQEPSPNVGTSPNDWIAGTIQTRYGGGDTDGMSKEAAKRVLQPITLDMRGNGDGKTVNTLTGDHASRPTDYTPVVFNWQSGGDCRINVSASGSDALTAHQTPAIWPCHAPIESARDSKGVGNYNNGQLQNAVVEHSQVRRLTPIECERLQGFPDGHTDVPFRNKPASDGPRYKALGNSMAVPVMHWIGSRIDNFLKRINA